MDVTNTALDALDLLTEHELAIGRLYQAYASRFPEQKDFWTRLSQDEQQHAQWLDAIRLKAQRPSSNLAVDRFPAAAIEHSIRYVGSLIEGTAQPDLTADNALSHAFHLEESLLENRYFEVFRSDSTEIGSTLARLAQAARLHFEQVRRALENAGPMSR
jgi:rubrerythrin